MQIMARASFVLMLVCIVTATAVISYDLGRSLTISTRFWNAYESLKCIGINWFTDCSIVSTHLPIGLVMLVQSE